MATDFLSQNGMVEVDELKMLVNMLYNVDPAKGPTGNARVALQKLPVQADGKVEFWEFQALHNAFPSLLFPAFRLQVKVSRAGAQAAAFPPPPPHACSPDDAANFGREVVGREEARHSGRAGWQAALAE
jgi:hypothetical protein